MTECAGGSGEPPATLAEFLLDFPIDFYDISLIGGFNIPVFIVPSGGAGYCKSATCLSDLNHHCPRELQVRQNEHVVACKSACLAFNHPEYCFTGAYTNPSTCKLSNYSRMLKDSLSIFTCTRANYILFQDLGTSRRNKECMKD